jgi:hypothetical protein
LKFTPEAFANFSLAEFTPEAFANFSPGFEHRENPGELHRKNRSNPARVRQLANAFSVPVLFQSRTQGCRCAPTAGLKLANAFGVNPTELKLANAFGVNPNCGTTTFHPSRQSSKYLND